MVKNVHDLRRSPVGALQPHELARLIGQDVGLSWLLPPAGGWYDDDLLYAVVTRRPEVWANVPGLVGELKEAVTMLAGLSRYVQQEVDDFLPTLTRPSSRPG